jgi:putative membrane protein
MSTDSISQDRFKIMERKLYYGIATPGGVLTTLLGLWLLAQNFTGYMRLSWMHAKLALVLLLWVYHVYCSKLLNDFKADKNKHSPLFYRYFNEIPVLILIGVVILVVVK